MLRNRRNGNKCLETGENVFSHFQTLLGLEKEKKCWKVGRLIGEKVSINRRNGRKCLEMGENSFSHLQTLSVFKVFCSFSCFQTLLEKVVRLEGWKVKKLEGWKVGRIERRLEGEKVGRFKGFCRFPCFQTLLEKVRRLKGFYSKLSAAGAKRGVRSVSVRSVSSRRFT